MLGPVRTGIGGYTISVCNLAN